MNQVQTPRFTSTRLSVMMFLQFFIWGAWYPVVAVYMSRHGMGDVTHWPYTVNPIAAIIAPFFLGLIADRYFDTEKIYALLHLLGGAIMLFVPWAVDHAVLFIGLLLLYNLCYMPTLSLANTLSFHHIQSQEKQFPIIRVFGTIGWIVAGLIVSFVLVYLTAGVAPAQTAAPLYLTAAASILLGLYSFTLPHTPPPAAGRPVSIRTMAGLDAISELGDRPFWVFLICSVLICIPLAAYYNFTQLFLGAEGFQKIAAIQTLGQMSEVVFMLIIPLLFVRLGVKWMLAVGMGAWALRYGLFALGAPDAVTWMILGGLLLHGVCYDFFFVTGQIYIDKKATPAVRGQAQGLIILATYGVGLLVGAQITGNVYAAFLGQAASLAPSQWATFWLLPAAFAVVVMLIFIALFRDRVLSRARGD